MAMLPLCVAASRDDLEVLKLSKEDVTNWANSAIPDEYDPSLARPVQGADGEKKNVVNTAKAKDVEMLVEDLKHNVNEQDHQGLAALHWAVLGRPKGDDERHAACLKILLENGADTELFSLKGWVPLHYAISSGDLEGTRVLLEHGANIEVQDPMGQTPLHRAAIAGRTECLRTMLQCERCTSDTVNLKDDMGRTVMHWACLHNRQDMVTMCIKKGVNIGIADKSGRLAEELAAQKGHRRLLKWLNEGAFPKSENPHLMRATAAKKRNHRQRKASELVQSMKDAGLEQEAASLECIRDQVLEATEIKPATISEPSIEALKVDLVESAEGVRGLVASIQAKADEDLAPGFKEEICEELTKLAEDFAPAAI